MELLLLGTYYYFMILLLAGFFIALIFVIKNNLQVFRSISWVTYVKLALLIALGIFLRQNLATYMPKVMNDEFFYIATAENMAREGHSFPYLFRSFPPAAPGELKFIPPYPQLWPVILSFFFRMLNQFHYEAACAFSLFISYLVPIPVFFAGYLFFSKIELKGLKKEDVSPETAGLFSALLWVLMPVSIKLAASGAPETTSSLFIALFLFMAFLYMYKPVPTNIWGVVLSLSLAVHSRPENLLYVLLLIPLFIVTKTKPLQKNHYAPLAVLLLFCLISVMILGFGMGDPGRNYVFQIERRVQYDSNFQNFAANLLNNFLFLFMKNYVNPLIYTLLGAAGMLILFLKRSKNAGTFLLCWFCLFFFIFTPFPFGDYSNSSSADAYRFSLHLYFPLILSASYACFEIWNWVRQSKVFKLAPLAVLVLFLAGLGSLYLSRPFFAGEHPDVYYFLLLRRESQKIKEYVQDKSLIFLSEKPDSCLLIRYAADIPTYLILDQVDVNNIDQKDIRIFYFPKENPSELVLENFYIDVFTRLMGERGQYAIFELEKIQREELTE